MSDFKITKPGKYLRRDGVVETVHAILPPECGLTYVAHGSCGRTWTLSGAYNAAIPRPFDLIAPWTEPRFRAWRAEEVPDNCWVRHPGWALGVRVQITEVDCDGVYLGRECGKITLEALFVHYIQTNGNRCGVEEAQ